MAKTSRTTQSGQHQKRSVRKHTTAFKIVQLRSKIDWAFRAGTFRNPCIIKHCPAKQGFGVFARHDLRKGTLVAYYAIKLARHDTKTPSPTKGMYVTGVPSSPSNLKGESRTFFGDIGQHAGDVFGHYMFRGKPVCGHVFNEPGKDEVQNCTMPDELIAWDASLLKEGTGKSRAFFKEGDLLFHAIKTLRTVKAGEELMTVYGDDYERNYTRGKKISK